MKHPLRLEIPDDIYELLVEKAEEAGRAPEEAVSPWLFTVIRRLTHGPLLQLGERWLRSLPTLRAGRHSSYGLSPFIASLSHTWVNGLGIGSRNPR